MISDTVDGESRATLLFASGWRRTRMRIAFATTPIKADDARVAVNLTRASVRLVEAFMKYIHRLMRILNHTPQRSGLVGSLFAFLDWLQRENIRLGKL